MKSAGVVVAGMVYMSCAAAVLGQADTGAAEPVEQSAPEMSSDTLSEPEPTGSLRIVSVPPGAAVVLDGEERGETPLELSGLKPGAHKLQLRKPGHYLKKATLRVRADTTLDINLKLTKPASLHIRSRPEKATVGIDGKKVGTTPWSTSTLKPGTHTITVTTGGYRAWEKSIKLGSGQSDTLDVALEKTGTAGKPTAPPTEEAAEEDVDAVDEEATEGPPVGRIVVLSVFALFGIGILLAELTGP